MDSHCNELHWDQMMDSESITIQDELHMAPHLLQDNIILAAGTLLLVDNTTRVVMGTHQFL